MHGSAVNANISSCVLHLQDTVDDSEGRVPSSRADVTPAGGELSRRVYSGERSTNDGCMRRLKPYCSNTSYNSLRVAHNTRVMVYFTLRLVAIGVAEVLAQTSEHDVVRVSLGQVSNFSDVQQVLRFARILSDTCLQILGT